MGIKNLTSYSNNNIELTTYQWRVNKSLYHELRKLNSSNIKNFNQRQKKENNNIGNINLIVDAKTFFYNLGGRINWFVFDSLSLLKLLRKVNIIIIFRKTNIIFIFYLFIF